MRIHSFLPSLSFCFSLSSMEAKPPVPPLSVVHRTLSLLQLSPVVVLWWRKTAYGGQQISTRDYNHLSPWTNEQSGACSTTHRLRPHTMSASGGSRHEHTWSKSYGSIHLPESPGYILWTQTCLVLIKIQVIYIYGCLIIIYL